VDKRRNCAWGPGHRSDSATPVWAHRDNYTATCPKCVVTPDSRRLVEWFRTLKHLRITFRPEVSSAKDLDAFCVLETEYQKELNYGAR
jgi:hypothetical protein